MAAVLVVVIASLLYSRLLAEEPCVQLDHCATLEPGWENSVVYITCLRRLASPLAWNARVWNRCAARAFLKLIEKILWAVKTADAEKNEDQRDAGAVFLAILLAEALDHCEANASHRCVGVTWREIERVLEWSPPILQLFKHRQSGLLPTFAAFKYRAIEHMSKSALECHVLVFGPYGFHNEPFFAPGLALPEEKLKVSALIIEREIFDSSVVQMSTFPWSLQSDAHLGALFVRDVIIRTRARFIFSGDSIAVLMIAKLAVELNEISDPTIMDLFALACMKRSVSWPPLYPPPTLSKLIPGHEAFAPQEEIVCDNDGLTEIAPDLQRVREAWNRMGKNVNVYLKKEFSEAGRGVARPHNESDILRVVQKIWSRSDGIGFVDLDVKIRIFLQREIKQSSGRSPVGFRFYAERGQIYGAHLSIVEMAVPLYGVSYATIRDIKVEQAGIDFIRAVNYTGFGALWFWQNETAQPFLIDFNPRLERHACINAVLIAAGNSENVSRDPCSVFQRRALGETFENESLPLIVDGGFRYLEPMRVLNLGLNPKANRFVALLRSPEHFWNLHQGDHDLYLLHRKNVDAFLQQWDEMMKSE